MKKLFLKHSLFLAVSAIALTVVADQLFAAESETPTPSERAAPARRAAPQRARPAPTPQRQASTSQSSSFTGTQAGGFGGGNVGGGGFADPAFCGFDEFDPRCGTTTQNIGKSTGVLGGLELGQMFPMAGVWAWGWAVDAQGNTLRSENSQQTTKFISSGPFAGNTTSESFSTSQTQPFGTTLRLKLGVMAMPGTLIYVTGGGAGAMVHGDFNWTGTTVGFSGSGTTASGANTYDKFRWGYTVGGGVTFSVPGIPGGITLEYLHTDLGTVDQTIPLTCNTIAQTPSCVGNAVATTSMKTVTDALRLKFSIGL